MQRLFRLFQHTVDRTNRSEYPYLDMKKVYEELGEEVKNLRLVAGESIDDVCDAVEMQQSDLRKIETGQLRPEEEILALLLSHFEVDEIRAIRMWRLAGYDADVKTNQAVEESTVSDDKKDDNQIRINIPGDQPVLYTDMVQVMSNQYGVVLHFLQLTPNQQATVVSRIGMSKEHAQSLLELLKRNLEDSE